MFWKFYFIVLCILNASGFAKVEFRIWEFIDAFFSIFFLLGFWGMAWKKKIWKMSFWKIFFVGFVFWNVTYMYLIPLPIFHILHYPPNALPQWLFSSINLFVISPGILALYFYSYKNYEVWEKN